MPPPSVSMVLEVDTISVPTHGFIKMEDRKRTSPTDHHDDLSPAAKRQNIDVKMETKDTQPATDPILFGTNGTPWQVDLETFQKDAILRNMREIKREKAVLEAQLSDSEKRNQSNEEAMQFVEAFIDQLSDELKVYAGRISAVQTTPTGKATAASLDRESRALRYSADASIFTFTSAKTPLTLDLATVKNGLALRMTAAKEAIEMCLASLPPSPPETRPLQQKLNEVLGQLKNERKKLNQMSTDMTIKEEGLLNATARYMTAETRIDRMKSTVVNNLERQGRMASTVSSESEQINGDGAAHTQIDGEALQKAKIEADEATAEASKRREHIDQLQTENEKLSAELTALTTRLSSLSDDEYAKTELFRASKSQHEDLIKRINNLEAINIQLREEAKKLREDRMLYRKQTDEDAQKLVEESEAALVGRDADLQRIRQERDSLMDKLAMLKASKSESRVSLEKLEGLMAAKDERIAAFESEVARLKSSLESGANNGAMQNGDAEETLQQLQKEIAALKAENAHTEEACTKYHALTLKKVAEFQQYEQQAANLNVEKQKADQKYFSAMKAKESAEAKNRILDAKNAKTSALISTYKSDSDKLSELIRTQEKQLAEYKEQVETMAQKQQTLQSRADSADAKVKLIEQNINGLKETIDKKEASSKAAEKAQREAEVALEQSKSRLSEVQRKVETLGKKAKAGDPTSELEMLKRVAYCSSCSRNLKDTMIKTCGHVLCKECVDERIASRSRKCPHCLKPFGTGDCVAVHLI